MQIETPFRKKGGLRLAVASLAVATLTGPLTAQETPPATPAPPSNVVAVDHPGDAGTAIDLTWELSPTDKGKPDGNPVTFYEIFRKAEGEAEFVSVGIVPFGTRKHTDSNCEDDKSYSYHVVTLTGDGGRSAPAATSTAVSPQLQYFDTDRGWFAVLLTVICGAVIIYIQLAKSGAQLKVRKIAGLAAVEEAVGRATEMGRSILFVPGIQDMNDIQTVAGITILGRVAKVAAEHDASLEVPTSRSLVMTAARETVQTAFLAAGRPDAYNEDKIYYVTDEQFGYVAALSGLMVREKPAACFYLGSFFAESLILAETGNSVGAIQVAGTAQPAQLPFFVAACDYTLIGEEFFAASAYLSGDPEQMGSLKGQDVGKLIVAILIIVGCILATLYSITQSPVVGNWLSILVDRVLG